MVILMQELAYCEWMGGTVVYHGMAQLLSALLFFLVSYSPSQWMRLVFPSESLVLLGQHTKQNNALSQTTQHTSNQT